jgi:spore coat protein JB
MTEREKLLNQLGAVRFAMLDLHLYLDSHPGDCNAASKLEEYRKTAAALVSKYESAYGPLNQSQQYTSRWAWISDPWPWD